jgi:GNAT superfamily N-acetyltransferase
MTMPTPRTQTRAPSRDRRRTRGAPQPTSGLPPGFRIRPATAKDAQAVCTLIRGLAEYERRSLAVTTTPARLRRDGFGRRPYFRTLLCVDGRTPVGFALYFYAYSTFLGQPILYLKDLFVVGRLRGRGVGTALLAAVARIAVDKDCARMMWSVLRWNAPALRFYRRLGAAVPAPTWKSMWLGGPALGRLAAAARARAAPSRRRDA